MNRDAQENFRLSYRNKIANWYNGYLHIAIIFGIGFSLLYIYLQYIDQPSIFDFLTIPITFIAANFFEWYLHNVYPKALEAIKSDKDLKSIHISTKYRI